MLTEAQVKKLDHWFLLNLDCVKDSGYAFEPWEMPEIDKGILVQALGQV